MEPETPFKIEVVAELQGMYTPKECRQVSDPNLAKKVTKTVLGTSHGIQQGLYWHLAQQINLSVCTTTVKDPTPRTRTRHTI
jgi:hypothetical protein